MLSFARKFSLFSDIQSLNYVVNSFKETIRGFVPKSIVKVVDFLPTHSAKIKGVSFATYDYMADITGLSASTLKRAIKRLIDLGFIQVVNVWIDGRQRANIYQIQANINLEELAERLMSKVSFEFFEPSNDTQNDTEIETQNDTLEESDKPSIDADYPSFLKMGSSKAFQATQTLTDNNIVISSESFKRLISGDYEEDDPFLNSLLISHSY